MNQPNEIQAANRIDTSLIVYNYSDETLVKLREEAKDVRLVALDDQESLKKVRETRLLLRKVRVALEKRRKELKEDALRFGQEVDSEAKRLIGIIEPQEKRLQDEEDSVERELERQRALLEQQRRERAEKRLREIQAVTIPGDSPNVLAIVEMPEEQYQATLRALTNAHTAWVEAQEKARRQAEEERLQRLDEERRMREQREADDRARAAERKALEDARAENERLRAAAAAEAAAAQKAMDDWKKQRAEEQDRLDREREQAALERAELDEEKRRVALEQEAALPVPAEEQVRHCPTCGQVWSNP